MRKLILHSDQVEGKTQIDEAFLGFFDFKPKIAYIPSQSDLDRKYFNKKVKWYKQFGINDLFYFDLDKEFKKEKIKELLSCNAIHLSGGDVFCFLNNIKKRGFVSLLRDYVEKGGVLIGVSAGSIIMSEVVDIAALYDKESMIHLEDYSSLGLVDFEFFPHLNRNREKYLKDLIKYSKSNDSVIYACSDGDGIIVDGEEIRFFGDVLKIENGKVLTMD